MPKKSKIGVLPDSIPLSFVAHSLNFFFYSSRLSRALYACKTHQEANSFWNTIFRASAATLFSTDAVLASSVRVCEAFTQHSLGASVSGAASILLEAELLLSLEKRLELALEIVPAEFGFEGRGVNVKLSDNFNPVYENVRSGPFKNSAGATLPNFQ